MPPPTPKYMQKYQYTFVNDTHFVLGLCLIINI